MTARNIAALVVLGCLIALAVETHPKPRNLSPSRLERTCFYKGAWLPCFIRDEATSQTWDI